MMMLKWAATTATELHEFHPGDVWLDTDGKRIQAHQPHVFGPLNGTYYWYGSSKVGTSDGTAGVINVYSSVDLYNWKSHGPAFECGTYCARPSFLGENPQTGLLKTREVVKGLPFVDVDYCAFGAVYRKRTRLWTNCTWTPSKRCEQGRSRHPMRVRWQGSGGVKCT